MSGNTKQTLSKGGSGSGGVSFPGWGLYVHFPFCSRRCNYCGFYSGRFSDDTHYKYIEALKRELSVRMAKEHYTHGPLRSIYFGGGTPSAVQAASLRGFMEWLRLRLEPVWDVREFTLEMNPEDVSSDSIREWISGGATRASIGIQSFHDRELKFMGRRHSARDARRALDLLCRKFDSVSFDLITGVPGQSMGSVAESVDIGLSYGAGHVSAYTLSIEPRSVMELWHNKGEIHLDEELALDMMFLVKDKLESAGIMQYEISNYARVGEESLHNSSYWNGAPYMGLGPSAHSYDGVRQRGANAADIRSYLDEYYGCSGSENSILEWETLGEKELLDEFVMLGIRMRSGVELEEFVRRFGKNACESFLRAAKMSQKRGLVEIEEWPGSGSGSVKLTRKGIALADSVTLDLLATLS